MADYQEGHILTNKATGEKVILRGNAWVPHTETAPQPPAQAGVGGTQTPGKVAAAAEPPPPSGEQVGVLEDIGRSTLPKLTSGVVGLATLPRTGTDLVGQLLGLDPSSVAGAGPRYPSYNETMTGIETAMPSMAYRPQTRPGKYWGTAMEMLPGAGFGPGGVGARGLQWLGGSVGSEALGQATEGTAMEPWARMAGTMAGTTVLPKLARRFTTPNPYDQKMLADLNAYRDRATSDLNAQRGIVGANTSFPEDPKFSQMITALQGGPVNVGRYRTESFGKLNPQEQSAARLAANPPAPWYTGPGAAPPGPPPTWTGAQVAHMDEAILRDLAKSRNPAERQSLLLLKKAHDDAMARATKGGAFEDAWKDLNAQRSVVNKEVGTRQAALDADVEQRIAGAGGGPGRALLGTLGAVAANMASHKMGMPGWGLEAMLMAAGGGLGGAGASHLTKKVLPSFKDMIPGMYDYRRNQVWQPGGPATSFSPARNLGMIGSGEILPPLVQPPPQ